MAVKTLESGNPVAGSGTLEIMTICLHILENIDIPFLSFIVLILLETLNNYHKIWQPCR